MKEKEAKVIAFPDRRKQQSAPGDLQEAPANLLRPSLHADRELDRAMRSLQKDDPDRLNQINSMDSNAFSTVFRLLRKRPEVLLVFCNTVAGPNDGGALWGDVYCLTDDDLFRYIFTVYTRTYVTECRRFRGETIRSSAENIILEVAELSIQSIREATELWVREYYPGLSDVPVQLEDPKNVREMILDSLLDDETF